MCGGGALVNVAAALAVLSGSMLAAEDTRLSKLGGITRMEALANISGWPLATQAQWRWGKVPRGHPEANHWPEGASRKWWATDVFPPTRSLTGKQAGWTKRGVATAARFVAVGGSTLSGDFALALAMLLRSRLALEVTGQSNLDGILRMEVLATILA